MAQEEIKRAPVVEIVYLHELSQAPREISGVLSVATFTDFNVREMNTEIVVIDPEIVDEDGQTRGLTTHKDRRWWPHPDEYFAEQNRAIRMARRHVRLSELLEQLARIRGEEQTEVKLNFTAQIGPTSNS